MSFYGLRFEEGRKEDPRCWSKYRQGNTALVLLASSLRHWAPVSADIDPYRQTAAAFRFFPSALIFGKNTSFVSLSFIDLSAINIRFLFAQRDINHIVLHGPFF